MISPSPHFHIPLLTYRGIAASQTEEEGKSECPTRNSELQKCDCAVMHTGQANQLLLTDRIVFSICRFDDIPALQKDRLLRSNHGR